MVVIKLKGSSMEKEITFDEKLEDSANRIVEEVFGPEFAKEYIELKSRFEIEGE